MTDTDQWVVLYCYATFEAAVIERIRRKVPQAEVRQLQLDALSMPGFLVWRWDPLTWDDVRDAGGGNGLRW
jgi:hypothetical protein